MSNGAYILAHFANQESLIPAAKKLTGDKSVARWDAVDGHVNLVVKAGDSDGASAAVKALTGVDRTLRYDIQQDFGNGATLDPALCHAYVFIETENGKREQICKALQARDDVLSCSATQGGCDLVAIVKGPTFTAVDRTVEEEIRPLDGVLRLKHNRIIDLQQL